MKKVKKGRIKHGVKKEAILRCIKRAGLITTESLIKIFLTVPLMGAAMMSSSKSGAIQNMDSMASSFEGVDFTSPNSIYSLVAKLGKDGLIRKEDGVLKILKRGIKYLQERVGIPQWNKHYEKKRRKSNTLNLVIFDIPEKERMKRDWLRKNLKDFGYAQVQQSVWFGSAGLALEFIGDVERYGMRSWVHIIKITKQGSLTNFLRSIGRADLADE